MDQPARTANLNQIAPAARFYAPELDGLRFIAALLVFLDHAPLLPGAFLKSVQAYGWAGVDLFLALSAYLITRLLLLERQCNGRVSLRDFYIRRALRIWPLYLGYASAACLFTLVHRSLAGTQVLTWWASHLTLTNNLLTAALGWSPVPFTWHLWTISLEEQAYLLLPALVLAAPVVNAGKAWLLAVSCAIIVALVALRLGLFVTRVDPRLIYVTPLRGDAFVLGAVAAMLVDRAALRPSAWLIPLGVVLLASPTLFRPVYDLSWYHVFGYSATAAGATTLMLGAQAAGPIARLLSTATLRYLGRISYGIYVFHLLAIGVAVKLAERAHWPNIAAFSLALALTVLAAAASYHLWERPFLKLKRRFERVASRPA